MINYIDLKAIKRTRKTAKRNNKLFKPTSIAVGLCLAMSAIAGPVGGQVDGVDGGTASITHPDSLTTVIDQSSDRASINWKTFDVNSNETVQFNQPNAHSITLNRVTGGLGASQIYGKIQANGQVWILNPDGIHFGNTAIIDVAGILASTYNMSTENFMKGNHQFEAFSGEHNGSIYNEGEIKVSGLAAMLSHDVENAGIIHAELATVVLGSNPTWVLDAYGDDTINFAVSDELLQRKASLSNSGKIYSDGGSVFLSVDQAKEVIGNAINVSGEIHADTVSMEDGVIVLSGGSNSLVSVSGELTARGEEAGESGGRIHVTGDLVGAFDDAKIDVSGKAHGGEILLGGDYKGQGFLPTASSTYVGQNVDLIADSDGGDAGKIIVWSDGYTAFHGDALARALGATGDGGFVETSGKQLLNATNSADVSSVGGKGGTWLLDPYDLIIVAKGSSSSADIGSTSPFVSMSDQSKIYSFLITSALQLGDVVIQTGSGGRAGKGDIILDTYLKYDSNYNLTLNAINDILFRSGNFISNTLSGSIILRSDFDGDGHGTVRFDTTAVDAMGDVLVYYNHDPDGGDSDFSTHINSANGKVRTYQYINDLAGFKQLEGSKASFALNRDIDATGVLDFVPIGLGESGAFMGVLDGLGHSISNLNINININGLFIPKATNIGLFSSLSIATVKNLNLVGGSVVGGENVSLGALAGRASNSQIENVHSSMAVKSGNGSTVGGLVGFLSSDDTAGRSSITLSSSSGDVTGGDGSGKFGGSTVGGLVGYAYESNIFGSHAMGNVTAGSSAFAGGLVGYYFDSQLDSIEGSSASGRVLGGSDSHVGGFVGNFRGGRILNSFATGDVLGGANASVGGFAGYAAGKSTNNIELAGIYARGNVTGADGAYVGGLAGVLDNVNVHEGYSTGKVTGGVGSTVGGLFGRLVIGNNFDGTTLSSLAWDIETSGQKSATGETIVSITSPLTEAQSSALLYESNVVYSALVEKLHVLYDLLTNDPENLAGREAVVKELLAFTTLNDGKIDVSELFGATLISELKSVGTWDASKLAEFRNYLAQTKNLADKSSYVGLARIDLSSALAVGGDNGLFVGGNTDFLPESQKLIFEGDIASLDQTIARIELDIASENQRILDVQAAIDGLESDIVATEALLANAETDIEITAYKKQLTYLNAELAKANTKLSELQAYLAIVTSGLDRALDKKTLVGLKIDALSHTDIYGLWGLPTKTIQDKAFLYDIGSASESEWVMVNDGGSYARLASEVGRIQMFGISTAEELQLIAADLAGDYFLKNNIDASATKAWNHGDGFVALGGLGGLGYSFTGSLDGNGYSISNLTINNLAPAKGTTAVGLFGATYEATIKDLHLVGGVVSSTLDQAYVGSLIGAMQGGLVSGVSSSMRVIAGYNSSAGGLVGYAGETKSKGGTLPRIINSYATGDVSMLGVKEVSTTTSTSDPTRTLSSPESTLSSLAFAGGLVGGMRAGSIDNSFATGNVRVGSGVQKFNLYSDEPIVDPLTGAPEATRSYAGGLVGYALSDVIGDYGYTYRPIDIRNSYAKGAVTGGDFSFVGGLLGLSYSAFTVENNYAAGKVVGGANSLTGGLFGFLTLKDYYLKDLGAFTPSMAGNYWDIQKTGQNRASGLSTLLVVSNISYFDEKVKVLSGILIDPDVQSKYTAAEIKAMSNDLNKYSLMAKQGVIVIDDSAIFKEFVEYTAIAQRNLTLYSALAPYEAQLDKLQEKLVDNNLQLADLKVRLSEATTDKASLSYQDKIAAVEKDNAEMQTAIDGYELFLADFAQDRSHAYVMGAHGRTTAQMTNQDTFVSKSTVSPNDAATPSYDELTDQIISPYSSYSDGLVSYQTTTSTNSLSSDDLLTYPFSTTTVLYPLAETTSANSLYVDSSLSDTADTTAVRDPLVATTTVEGTYQSILVPTVQKNPWDFNSIWKIEAGRSYPYLLGVPSYPFADRTIPTIPKSLNKAKIQQKTTLTQTMLPQKRSFDLVGANASAFGPGSFVYLGAQPDMPGNLGITPSVTWLHFLPYNTGPSGFTVEDDS